MPRQSGRPRATTVHVIGGPENRCRSREILKRCFGSPSEHLVGFKDAGWIHASPIYADENWWKRARTIHLKKEISFLETAIVILELEISHPTHRVGAIVETVQSKPSSIVNHNYHGNVGAIQNGNSNSATTNFSSSLDLDAAIALIERLRESSEIEVAADDIVEVRELIDGIEKEVITPRGSLIKAKALARGLAPMLHGAAGNLISDLIKLIASA